MDLVGADLIREGLADATTAPWAALCCATIFVARWEPVGDSPCAGVACTISCHNACVVAEPIVVEFKIPLKGPT